MCLFYPPSLSYPTLRLFFIASFFSAKCHLMFACSSICPPPKFLLLIYPSINSMEYSSQGMLISSSGATELHTMLSDYCWSQTTCKLRLHTSPDNKVIGLVNFVNTWGAMFKVTPSRPPDNILSVSAKVRVTLPSPPTPDDITKFWVEIGVWVIEVVLGRLPVDVVSSSKTHEYD